MRFLPNPIGMGTEKFTFGALPAFVELVLFPEMTQELRCSFAPSGRSVALGRILVLFRTAIPDLMPAERFICPVTSDSR